MISVSATLQSKRTAKSNYPTPPVLAAQQRSVDSNSSSSRDTHPGIARLTRSAWKAARQMVRECNQDIGQLAAVSGRIDVDSATRARALFFAKIHLEGRLPLSHFYGRYTRQQWISGFTVFRNHPASLALASEAREFDERMQTLLGPTHCMLFGNKERQISLAVEKVRNIADAHCHWFKEESGVAPTVQNLVVALLDLKEGLQRGRLWMRQLSDLKLYDKTTDPDWIITKLSQTDARYEIQSILELVHGWRWLGRPGEATIHDLLYGRISATGALDQHNQKEAAIKRRLCELDLRARRCLKEVTCFLEDQSTYHIPSLNRKLQERFQGLYRIQRYIPGKPEYCLAIRDSRYITSHHSKSKCTNGFLLVNYFIALEDALRQKPDGDEAWFRAEHTAGGNLDLIVHEIESSDNAKRTHARSF